ncbi:MAG TPA: flagellin [Rhodopila sp.]|nr:flagellin [Rhodopila sp.]
MTSILTNSGAMVALQSLEATQKALSDTQNQISTGLKIQTAKDNAAVWTVATTMKANVASLNQVSSDLGNADSTLGTAVAGATQITSLVSQIRAQAVSMTDSATNTAATGQNIKQLMSQIQATISSSSFNGVNLLNSDTTAGVSFIAATANDYNPAGGSGTSTYIATGATINLSSAGTVGNTVVSAFNALMTTLTGGAALTSGTGAGTLNNALATIDAYSAQVESQASALGSVQKNVESQQTFVNNLANTFTTGAGNMVDANMTAESAMLTALQTQQQLGTSALSIANQAPQSILKLFP